MTELRIQQADYISAKIAEVLLFSPSALANLKKRLTLIRYAFEVNAKNTS
jgi:hypothetical protein